jgi:hypothetical protein
MILCGERSRRVQLQTRMRAPKVAGRESGSSTAGVALHF